MLLHLNRTQTIANACLGAIFIEGTYVCDTLENNATLIPEGIYRITLTMSPKFGEVLPLLHGVYGYADKSRSSQGERTGIRIHAGNKASDSSGCILVGKRPEEDKRTKVAGSEAPTPRIRESRRTLRVLCEQLIEVQRSREEIYIDIRCKTIIH